MCKDRICQPTMCKCILNRIFKTYCMLTNSIAFNIHTTSTARRSPQILITSVEAEERTKRPKMCPKLIAFLLTVHFSTSPKQNKEVDQNLGRFSNCRFLSLTFLSPFVKVLVWEKSLRPKWVLNLLEKKEKEGEKKYRHNFGNRFSRNAGISFFIALPFAEYYPDTIFIY